MSTRSRARAKMRVEPAFAGEVVPCCPPDENWIWRCVHTVGGDVAADLRSRGLRLAETDFASSFCFYLAARHLALIPTLEVELARLVRQVTLLEADPGYDVSHSEPRWPNAIFVSAPPLNDRHAALRLLENVVHEGMHLRLTEIERITPLVREGAGRIFSPWKSETRQAQGVLHGLYVFVCIAALFANPLLLAGLDDNERVYASRRISEIGTEIGEVDLKSLEQCLTEDGRRFLRTLLASTAHANPWTLSSCADER